MDPKNLLLIVSDEHNPKVLGCAGHEEICTPHLDALARGGTRFTNAVCASPICVPTRAALATGRNIFETGYWDNVDAYDGRIPSWHHVLRSAGHEVVSIGKLHYRGWEGDDYGFSQSLLPMHIHGGRGEVKMLLRNPPAALGDGSNMLRSAKAGESDYTHYDGEITKAAVAWLRAKGCKIGSQGDEKPWVLMVSLVAPHFPLTVPAEYFDPYSTLSLKMPKRYRFGVDESAHPFLQQYAHISGYNNHFKNESDVRRALAGYYGLISYLDTNVGRVLQAVQEAGLVDDTRIMYISDHGDNAGARGLWGKSTMYSESVGIPMIISGPDVVPDRTVTTAVSHVDVYNSILDAVGHDLSKSTASVRARSVFGPLQPDRVVLSEYHTIGSKSAVFMIQDAETKYVHYCDHRPQFFDLVKDPEEINDLASTGGYQEQLAIWEARLRELCDPDQADLRAKQRQQELITRYGGEEAIRANVGIGGYSPSPLKNA